MIRDESTGGMLGRSLGSGLGEGLAALIEHKHGEILRKNQKKETHQFLKGLGISDDKAHQISQADPELIKEYIKKYVNQPSAESQEEFLRAAAQQYGGTYGPEEQANQQQGGVQNLMNSQNPHPNFGQQSKRDQILQRLQQSPYSQMLGPQSQQFGQPQQPNVLDQLNQLPGQELLERLQQQQGQQAPQKQQMQQEPPVQRKVDFSKLSPEQAIKLLDYQKGQGKQGSTTVKEKHYDDLIKQKQNLEDIVSTTDNMLKNLEGGIETGIWSGIKAGVAPTWLDEVSEEYDKDASHLINLTTSEIKGPASRFRVALVKKEKPGLEHSVKVNEQILKRIRKKAQDHLKDMQVRYPELGEVRQFGNENSNTFDERPNPAQYPGKKLLNEETGEYEISNGSKWVPYRGEQNGI